MLELVSFLGPEFALVMTLKPAAPGFLSNYREIQVDIFARLKQEHVLQRELAKQIIESPRNGQERAELFATFKELLENHLQAEQRALYSRLLAKADCWWLAARGICHQRRVTMLLRSVQQVNISSIGWMKRFERMNSEMQQQIFEEEEILFPIARKSLDLAVVKSLEQEFNACKPQAVTPAAISSVNSSSTRGLVIKWSKPASAARCRDSGWP